MPLRASPMMRGSVKSIKDGWNVLKGVRRDCSMGRILYTVCLPRKGKQLKCKKRKAVLKYIGNQLMQSSLKSVF